METKTAFEQVDRATLTRKQARKLLRKKSRFAEIMHTFSRNKLAVVGFIIIMIFVIIAVAAPLFIDYESMCLDVSSATRFAPVGTKGHWLGCDEKGRDLMARAIYGTRISLRIGITAIFFSMCFGVIVGAVAGYSGGVLDNVLMRIIDVIACLPSILLAMAIVAAFGTSEVNLVIAIAIATTADFARIVRSSVITTASMDYVEAARALGVPTFGIIFKHVMINSLAPIIVHTSLALAWSITAISSLSYIGLGIPAPTPEWGNMLSTGKTYMRDHANLMLVPGLCIFFTVLSLNLIGDGLRDALDPRLKQ